MSVEQEISSSIEKDFFKGKVIVILGARHYGYYLSIENSSSVMKFIKQ